MTFSPGDTVAVKSGGPALTVLSIDGDHVKCLFFSEELGEFKETVLPAFALEAFDEDEDDEDEEDAASEGDDEDGEESENNEDEDEDEKAA